MREVELSVPSLVKFFSQMRRIASPDGTIKCLYKGMKDANPLFGVQVEVEAVEFYFLDKGLLKKIDQSTHRVDMTGDVERFSNDITVLFEKSKKTKVIVHKRTMTA